MICMDDDKRDKISRVLQLYTRLCEGEVINKANEAQKYGVTERSIQRDIDDVRAFLDNDAERTGIVNSVIYDYKSRGYKLDQVYNLKLDNSEILAICKILLEARAFSKEVVQEMLDKLISCCVPKSNQERVKDLIRNEAFHYIEPRHGSEFIDKIWDIGQAVRESRLIEVDYLRLKDKQVVKRKLRPVAILFSEYYFYLTAFIDDKETRDHFDVINDSFPTIYRIDRIQSMKILDEKFHIPYSSRFEEGEFRKRIQFMYGGRLERVKFEYSGLDINCILDRLPTAQILDEHDGVYTVQAEVFGKGIDMWLRSQGDSIKLIA